MRASRWLIAFLIVNWTFLMLYPDPLVLWRSIDNIRHPSVDPAAVRAIAARLPNDPNAIRDAVLTRIMPYAYDWQVNGVPWYFPTTAQALRWGRGDCESQAVVLASILKAKGIPFRLEMSFDHIWVQYAGKQPNPLENAGVALAVQQHGRFVFHWPANFNLSKEARAQAQIYWTPMPLGRKMAFFGGIIVVLFLNALLGLARRRAAEGRAGDCSRPPRVCAEDSGRGPREAHAWRGERVEPARGPPGRAGRDRGRWYADPRCGAARGLRGAGGIG
jgi:hypothetical protein